MKKKCPGHKDKEKRDYKCENEAYGSRPEQVKRRTQRNRDRAKLEKKGLVRKGDGKDVHHTQPGNLRDSPVVVISASVNRAMSAPQNLRKMRNVAKKHARKS